MHSNCNKNGNITNLTRQGKLGGSELYGMIDDLTYTYQGNQLKSVNDDTYQSSGFSDNGIRLSTEYDYDNNGPHGSELPSVCWQAAPPTMQVRPRQGAMEPTPETESKKKAYPPQQATSKKK